MDSRAKTAPNKNVLASQRMRARIIAVSIEVLGAEGFSALTVGKLSQRAGISKGALYHHFSSLHEVRRAVLSSLLEPFISPDRPQDYADLHAYLSAIGDVFFQRLAAYPTEMKALYAFVAQALVDSDVKDEIQRLIRGSLSEYTLAVTHFYPGSSPRHIETAVQTVDAYFCGVVFHWFLLDDEPACRKSWEVFKCSLVHSLSDGLGR